MQQVFPDERVVGDPLALLATDRRPAPADRPWVMANMVASVDGAWAVDGRSGGLSGPADRAVFHSLRALADVVLVAAGTARAERYRRPWPVPEAQELRAARAQAPAARLAMVSRSLHVPADQPFLTGDGPDPLLFHPAAVDPAALDDLPHGVVPRVSGGTSVDLADVLGQLDRDEHAGLVLCEGGPRLLGQLHAADLLDELFVTISPALVGGSQVGMLGDVAPVVHRLDLHRVLVEEGSLLCTYRRRRD